MWRKIDQEASTVIKEEEMMSASVGTVYQGHSHFTELGDSLSIRTLHRAMAVLGETPEIWRRRKLENLQKPF